MDCAGPVEAKASNGCDPSVRERDESEARLEEHCTEYGSLRCGSAIRADASDAHASAARPRHTSTIPRNHTIHAMRAYARDVTHSIIKENAGGD